MDARKKKTARAAIGGTGRIARISSRMVVVEDMLKTVELRSEIVLSFNADKKDAIDEMTVKKLSIAMNILEPPSEQTSNSVRASSTWISANHFHAT